MGPRCDAACVHARRSMAVQHLLCSATDPFKLMRLIKKACCCDASVHANRSTAVRHLLCSATDPFTRAPLSLEALQDDAALRERIACWRAERGKGGG